jgi:hypothetical protein
MAVRLENILIRLESTGVPIPRSSLVVRRLLYLSKMYNYNNNIVLFVTFRQMHEVLIYNPCKGANDMPGEGSGGSSPVTREKENM